MDFHYFTFLVDNAPLKKRDQFLENPNIVSIFDLDKIICIKQIEVAVFRTNRSIKNKTNIGQKWGIEFILHLTAKHQIKEALKLVGISETTKRIGIIQNIHIPINLNFLTGFNITAAKNKNYHLYQLNTSNPCQEIISKGVRLIADHE